MKLPVLFALLTALCWGLYGPTLAQSRSAFHSPFKPYVLIGIAYLMWGVIGGLMGMALKNDTFSFTSKGSIWGFLAGTLGAWGAFTLTLSMFSGGSSYPHIVMALVFGGAVTVSALTEILRVGIKGVDPWLLIGILGILICSLIVALHTPHDHPPSPPIQLNR